MIDSNETMNKRTQVQNVIDQCVEIAGEHGLDLVAESVNGVLARLGASAQALSAVDREAARISGIPLSELAVQRARERSIADAAAKAPEAEMAAMRIFDGDAADPRLVIAQQRDAERELTALSFTVRSDLSKRCAGNPITMVLQARREGLFT